MFGGPLTRVSPDSIARGALLVSDGSIVAETASKGLSSKALVSWQVNEDNPCNVRWCVCATVLQMLRVATLTLFKSVVIKPHDEKPELPLIADTSGSYNKFGQGLSLFTARSLGVSTYFKITWVNNE